MLTSVAPSTSNINGRLGCRRHLGLARQSRIPSHGPPCARTVAAVWPKYISGSCRRPAFGSSASPPSPRNRSPPRAAPGWCRTSASCGGSRPASKYALDRASAAEELQSVLRAEQIYRNESYRARSAAVVRSLSQPLPAPDGRTNSLPLSDDDWLQSPWGSSIVETRRDIGSRDIHQANHPPASATGDRAARRQHHTETQGASVAEAQASAAPTQGGVTREVALDQGYGVTRTETRAVCAAD